MTLSLISRVEYTVSFEATVIVALRDCCCHPWRPGLSLAIWAPITGSPRWHDLEFSGQTGANAWLQNAVELQAPLQRFSLKFLVLSRQGKKTLQISHGKAKPVLNYALRCVFSCFTLGLQTLLLETSSVRRCRVKDFSRLICDTISASSPDPFWWGRQLGIWSRAQFWAILCIPLNRCISWVA